MDHGDVKDILPYSKCFKIGLVVDKVEENVEIPTPIGPFRTTYKYRLEETCTIPEYIRKFFCRIPLQPIVLLTYYGVRQFFIHSIERIEDKIIFVSIDKSKRKYIFTFILDPDEATLILYSFDTWSVKEFYNHGKLDIAKEIVLRDGAELEVKYSALYPATEFEDKGRDIGRSFPGYIHSTIYDRKFELKGKKPILVNERFMFRDSTLRVSHKIEGKVWKLTGSETSPEIHPRRFNYDNCYEYLARLEPQLKPSKKLMRKLLAQLDTGIFKTDKEKMGGPLMDPNLIRTIDEYMGENFLSSKSSEEENSNIYKDPKTTEEY